MTWCYLGLGSNLRTPARQIRQTQKLLQRTIPKTTLIKTSRYLRSTPCGRPADPPYCNAVALIKTHLSPDQLLQYCQKIETKKGRIRRRRWAARTVDIDILLYDQKKIRTPKLTIPHPEMLQRDFVLIPLLQLLEQTSSHSNPLLFSKKILTHQLKQLTSHYLISETRDA